MPDTPAQPFVWPPRPPAPAPLPAVEIDPPAPREHWWSIIEREWLDVTAPPLHERMATANWSPDAPVDYCPRCAETLDPDDDESGPAGACPHCREAPRAPWDRIVRLGEYRPPLSGWIHEVKFTRWRRLGTDLGRLLGDALAAQMLAAGLPGDARVVIVPMPTTFRRLLARGIDHTLVLARGVAPRLNARVARPIRRAHRPSQTLVAPSARQINVAGAMGPKPRWQRAWSRRKLASTTLVIVLDDVTTTGSSLRAATRAVRECVRQLRTGSSMDPLIWAAVLAKTPHGHHDADDPSDA